MSPEKFAAHLDHQELRVVSPDVQAMLVEWWNVSRLHKHGSKAVWTELAFSLSVRRVALLPPWKQLALAQAGIEHGWQALKVEFIPDAKPPADAGLTPKSTAMQEAIDSWNNRVA
jgi:hypothetical protein